jgi:hypothetical protein
MLFGPKIENQLEYGVHNEVLHSVFPSASLTEVIKLKMRWAVRQTGVGVMKCTSVV